MRKLPALAFLVSLPSICTASTIWVPDDHATIQGAIGAAADGDEVVVRPGRYVENIDFIGKAITVRSEWGPTVTFIDGNQAGSVVTFDSGENASSILQGFTIENGSGTLGFGGLTYGGGIYVFASSPRITDCVVRGNSATEDGGGIYCDFQSAASVIRCLIEANEASYGAGFYSQESWPLVSGCVIRSNTASQPPSGTGGGGGLAFNDDSALPSSPRAENCLVLDNTADRDGGGLVCWGSAAELVNCTFRGNQAVLGGGGMSIKDGSSLDVLNCILWADGGTVGPEVWLNHEPGELPSALAIGYSDVQGGLSMVQVDAGCTLTWGLGMLDLDPLFFDSSNDDYRLRQDPPQPGSMNLCVDGGDPASAVVPGTTRTDWAQDVGVVDMGYHYPAASGPGTEYCFGDGSGTNCPCANTGGVGEGCANSSGQGGTLHACGSDGVAADDLAFGASQLLPGQPGLLFAGVNAVGGGQGNGFGDGLRCAGGSVVRLGVDVPGTHGGATWGPGLAALGGWGSGDTRRFQVWYRDPAGGPCGSTFNLTNGVEVTFTP